MIVCYLLKNYKGKYIRAASETVLKTVHPLKRIWIDTSAYRHLMEHKPDSRAGTDSKSDCTMCVGLKSSVFRQWRVNQLGTGVDWKSARTL